MSEQICRNCRWWERRFDTDDDGWSFCNLANGGSEPAHPKTKAWASDSEQYSACLNTQSDFGCVQWEEKE